MIPLPESQFNIREITPAEHEELKEQAAAPAAKTCPACGQPVEPAHEFCLDCSSKA